MHSNKTKDVLILQGFWSQISYVGEVPFPPLLVRDLIPLLNHILLIIGLGIPRCPLPRLSP